MTLRCKFRVLSITSSWDDSTLVSLRPCTAKDVSIDENGRRVTRENPENATFWKYTPSGEASLTFQKGKSAPAWVEKGAYVYVDVDLSGEVGDRWDASLHLFASGGIEASATSYLGHVKFTLSEEHARPVSEAVIAAFLPDHAIAAKDQRSPVKWGVSFIPTTEPDAIPE